MVNYRTPELAARGLQALARHGRKEGTANAVLVDGGSADRSADLLRAAAAEPEFRGWTTFLPLALNGGFGWANNQAIRRVLAASEPPEFIYLLNPDAMVEDGTVEALLAALLAEPRAAAAGSLLLGAGDTRQGSAFHFPSAGREFFRGASVAALERLTRTPPLVVESDETVEVDWVTGASVMFRAEALREVGLFDEGFFLYFEEVELMHRMKQAGWKVLHVPESRVRHIGGASTGIADGSSEQKRLPRYWFESRRRFFALTGGKRRAWLASAAWLAGNALWTLRCAVGLGRASSHAPREARDLLRHGLHASPRDLTPAVPAWDSPMDQPPAWMRES